MQGERGGTKSNFLPDVLYGSMPRLFAHDVHNIKGIVGATIVRVEICRRTSKCLGHRHKNTDGMYGLRF